MSTLISVRARSLPSLMLKWSLSTLVCATLWFLYAKAYHSGKTKDDEEVSGTITVPEVAHDTEENEYVVCLLVPHGRLVWPN